MNELDVLVESAAQAFTRTFGARPAWVSAAPGRVNLIGEHTDYNQGFVLPMAIDRWCVCAGAPAAGDGTRLVAHDIDADVRISLREAGAQGPGIRESLPGWARYVVGSLVEQGQSLGVDPLPEIDLLVTSSVPRGGGLSSSAALETACASFLEAATGRVSERLARALACQRAEHRWAGVPCGLMDQLASSFGVRGHALLIDCRGNTVTPVPMPAEDEAVVLVVNSGVHHELAGGEYARRRAACESAARLLGVGSLREIDAIDAVEWSRLGEEQARCVRHVVGENDRTVAAAAALRGGDMPTLGRLMSDSHASLRDDYRVSCPELDSIVEFAATRPGVYGARMTGGGFGGCAVVLATPEAACALAQPLAEAYHARWGIGCRTDRVVAADGAAAIRLDPR